MCILATCKKVSPVKFGSKSAISSVLLIIFLVMNRVFGQRMDVVLSQQTQHLLNVIVHI